MISMRDDLAFWVALATIPSFGAKRIEALARNFSTMREAWSAVPSALQAAGITPAALKEFLELRKQIDPQTVLQKVQDAGLNVLIRGDENYPQELESIYDPPAVLFVQGVIPKNDAPHLAIVGSRKSTPYGEGVAERFAHDLAQNGVVIVSGLAFGIDEAAHRATLDAGGITIAVLACGHDELTSRGRVLAKQIAQSGGAVISEFPLGTPALSHHHPIRNRIISGLSRATLVIEAAAKSGSLITARAALEQGRDVFAIPGPITSPTSEGTNILIQNGAAPALKPQDILDVFDMDMSVTPVAVYKPASPEEEQVLACLGATPVHIDEIVRQTNLAAQMVADILSELELNGAARHTGGMCYIVGV